MTTYITRGYIRKDDNDPRQLERINRYMYRGWRASITPAGSIAVSHELEKFGTYDAIRDRLASGLIFPHADEVNAL